MAREKTARKKGEESELRGGRRETKEKNRGTHTPRKPATYT